MSQYTKLRNAFYRNGRLHIDRITHAAIEDAGFSVEWDAIFQAAHSDEQAATEFLQLVLSVSRERLAA